MDREIKIGDYVSVHFTGYGGDLQFNGWVHRFSPNDVYHVLPEFAWYYGFPVSMPNRGVHIKWMSVIRRNDKPLRELLTMLKDWHYNMVSKQEELERQKRGTLDKF